MLFAPLAVMALAASSSPEVGSVAPDFTARDSDGNSYSLSQLVKDRTVVLAFFVKAFTGG
jgi:peroxiredoxin